MSIRHDTVSLPAGLLAASTGLVSLAADEAAGAYRESLGEAGQIWALAYAEGRVREIAGDHPAALSCLRRALNALGSDSSPLLLNAIVRNARAEALEAETADWLTSGIEGGAYRPEVALWAGHLRHAAGQLEAAANLLETCVAAVEEPSVRQPATRELVAVLHQLGQFDVAVELLQQAIDWFPAQESSLRVDRAGLLVGAGRHAEAIDEVDGVLLAEPEHPHALFVRGAALLNLGRRSEADASLGRAVALDSGLEHARATLLEEVS